MKKVDLTKDTESYREEPQETSVGLTAHLRSVQPYEEGKKQERNHPAVRNNTYI